MTKLVINLEIILVTIESAVEMRCKTKIELSIWFRRMKPTSIDFSQLETHNKHYIQYIYINL